MSEKKSRMKYATDEFGREILLKDDSLQVMMEWEKPYMEACIDALEPKGDVLEIGFGLGYSATHIQSFKPKSHTIIECDPGVVERAKEWAKNHANVRIVEGTWQDELPKLGKFDQVFFDDYSPFTAEQAIELEDHAKKTEVATETAKEVETALKRQLEMFSGVKFTDENLDEFHEYLLAKGDVELADIEHFVATLIEGKNITEDQKEKFLKKYYSEEISRTVEKSLETKKEEQILHDVEQERRQLGDRLIRFFDLCISAHMNKGARLSSYIDYYEFRKRETDFHKWLEQHEDVKYHEETIPIEVPENCKYYQGSSALVMVIEKL